MSRSILLIAVLLLPASALADDPLDKMTGTEDWNRAAPENPEAEWKDWYRGRVEWRRGGREIQAQRLINRRLAQLLLRAGAPGFEELHRILQAGPARTAGETAPVPRPKAPLRARASRRHRSLQRVAGEGGSGADADADADALGFETVPVERLDDSGQAIDEEGDRELQRLTSERRGAGAAVNKKRRPPAGSKRKKKR